MVINDDPWPSATIGNYASAVNVSGTHCDVGKFIAPPIKEALLVNTLIPLHALAQVRPVRPTLMMDDSSTRLKPYLVSSTPSPEAKIYVLIIGRGIEALPVLAWRAGSDSGCRWSVVDPSDAAGVQQDP